MTVLAAVSVMPPIVGRLRGVFDGVPAATPLGITTLGSAAINTAAEHPGVVNGDLNFFIGQSHWNCLITR